jgi:hypothetical protein
MAAVEIVDRYWMGTEMRMAMGASETRVLFVKVIVVVTTAQVSRAARRVTVGRYEVGLHLVLPTGICDLQTRPNRSTFFELRTAHFHDPQTASWAYPKGLDWSSSRQAALQPLIWGGFPPETEGAD